jgi:hypothetical protein
VTQPPTSPSWDGWLWRLIAVIGGLELCAGVLPRVLVPLIVLGVVLGLLRLIWWYTQL